MKVIECEREELLSSFGRPQFEVLKTVYKRWLIVYPFPSILFGIKTG